MRITMRKVKGLIMLNYPRVSPLESMGSMFARGGGEAEKYQYASCANLRSPKTPSLL